MPIKQQVDPLVLDALTDSVYAAIQTKAFGKWAHTSVRARPSWKRVREILGRALYEEVEG